MKTRTCVLSASTTALLTLCGVSHAQRGVAIPVCSGLIAEWKFEGNGIDTSGNANDGTVFNPAYTPGVAGDALLLDGTSTYAAFADSPSLNPPTAITVSAWYYAVPFVGSGNDSIVDKGAPSHSPPYYQYHLGLAGSGYNPPGSVGFDVAAGGGYHVAGSGNNFVENGRWAHFVGTYDGATCRFYADGVLINSTPGTGAIPAYGKPVFVGKFTNLGFHLPGKVDEVRLFDRAISPEEVELLFRSPDARPMVVPQAVNTCPGGSVTLEARHLATAGVTYKWRRNGTELSGQTSPTLVITSASTIDAASYDCEVTTPCGTQISLAARVTLCVGDLNADGQRNTADLTAFLGSFGQTVTPCSRGDLNADGVVNTTDLTTFLGRFGVPCE